MKTRFTILISLLGVIAALAATLTINIPGNPNTPGSDSYRTAEAFSRLYSVCPPPAGWPAWDCTGTPPPANVQQMTDLVNQWIITRTKDYERQKNNAAYSPPPLVMQPTPTPTPTPENTPTPTPTPTP